VVEPNKAVGAKLHPAACTLGVMLDSK
jgi:hypothetical protein